ncbi:shufflon system plasmid conjugative transfer pilus tip adhesin PilV [Massilia sp. BJB1822]|uniref:shufflon system plasmid conjugative transfer pilus tip adhesin PilV n=1 Tax=Massilia sp. BJB1822 TaxID=2744470 RepID=UPI00159389C2|nr:shufflon system plasmid conjugative transfer pilus tip adhesin PilV [Massilia sp. BJB1822]NVE00141.1 shufflon system plasmid conjugative transfer pilus tip adhesin PilV [Massilia sp. BJB1822]
MIELVGALAVGMLGLAGIMAWTDGALEDSKSQQAALYQAQLTQAARRYIDANYAALQKLSALGVTTSIDLTTLKKNGYLPAHQPKTNAYGQSPCVLVLPASSGQLAALVLGEGGAAIPAKNLAYVASLAGRGGGFIPAGVPAVAQGAYQSWSMPMAGFGGASCSGTAASANRLASALFFDGPGQLSSDFLYRYAVPGQPQLNRMETPLQMLAQATESSSDSLCVAGNSATYGRVAVDASGAVLHCRLGVWRRPGGMWREPVPAFTALPASGNQSGDVRMVSNLARAFRWNGSAWTTLMVDQSGRLALPGSLTAAEAMIGDGATLRAACAANGLLARDASGSLLSCQQGKWRALAESAIVSTAFQATYNSSAKNDSSPTFTINLADLPGSRPLFLTGSGFCQTSDENDSKAEVFLLPGASERAVGGCTTDTKSGLGRIRIGAFIPLQQIPENTVEVQVKLQNPADGAAGNRSSISLTIFNGN